MARLSKRLKQSVYGLLFTASFFQFSALLAVQAAEASLSSSAEPAAQPAAQASPFSQARRQQLDHYLDLLEWHQKLMGGIAISQGGQVLYERYLGFADLANQLKTGPNTRFRIGSVSKMFTAVMIFQLIDAGKLKLETPLSRFYPNLPQAEQITVSQLLSHRSGLANFTNSDEYESYMSQPQSREAMLARVSQGGLTFKPDSKAAYSNSNYLMLSLMLEKITGQSYAEVLQKRIIDPLQLEKTAYGGPIQTGDAKSYNFAKDWQQSSVTDMSIPIGAGAIVSTPRELNLFLRALFQGKLVSSGSLAKMTELQDGYGRGLFAINYGQQQAFGHNGRIDAFESTSVYFPKSDLNITLLSNGLNLGFNDLMLGILSLYHGDPFTPPDFSVAPIVLTPEALQVFAGHYASKQLPLKIEIKVVNGALQAQATGQGAFLLTPFPNQEFRQEPLNLRLVFAPLKDGKASAFTLYQAGQSFSFELE
jgi:D-alanyl-D-alanine carboxypeptidase